MTPTRTPLERRNADGTACERHHQLDDRSACGAARPCFDRRSGITLRLFLALRAAGVRQPTPFQISGDAMFLSSPIDAARRIAIPLELGLDAVGLLFFPVLVLVPRGVAPLVSLAGACAIGLVLPTGMAAFRVVQVPALLLGAALVWASVSAAWSIDPGHSLVIAARLAGLFAVGLALTAAADAVVDARRLLLCFYTGLIVALVLAQIQFATNGLLTRPWLTRGFFAPQLNHAADTSPFSCCRRARRSCSAAARSSECCSRRSF